MTILYKIIVNYKHNGMSSTKIQECSVFMCKKKAPPYTELTTRLLL